MISLADLQVPKINSDLSQAETLSVKDAELGVKLKQCKDRNKKCCNAGLQFKHSHKVVY